MDAPDLAIGEELEIEKGVAVKRRCALATLAGLILARAAPAWATPAARLSFEEFLKETVPVAKGLVADASEGGQDRYLRAVAAVAVKMSEVALPQMRSTGPGNYIGVNPGGDPFVVLHWRMDPGAAINIHPHIYANVVTLGLEGEAEVVNYEVDGARDWLAKEPFMVRRTVRQTLKQGDVNLVNLERNYMHGFRAAAGGARGLDITTRLLPNQPSPALIVKDPEAERTEARWQYDEPAMK